MTAELLMAARIMVFPVHDMREGLRSDAAALHACAADSTDPEHTACRVALTLHAVSAGNGTAAEQEERDRDYAFDTAAARLRGWVQGGAASPWGLDLEVAACVALRQVFVGHAASHAASHGTTGSTGSTSSISTDSSTSTSTTSTSSSTSTTSSSADTFWEDWQQLRYRDSAAGAAAAAEGDTPARTLAAHTAIELRLWEQELLSAHARHFQDRATSAMLQLLHRRQA